MTTPAVLDTERLQLRPLTPDDAPDLFPTFSHPLAMRYMDEPPHADVAATRAALTRILAPEGACYWAVALRDDPRTIGKVSFLGATAVPGIGYIFHPDVWGQGYAGEAVGAALTYGFNTLGLDRVEAWVATENRASRRLAQRLGFGERSRLLVHYPHRAAPHEMVVYGLLAHEWPHTTAEKVGSGPVFYQAQPVLPVRDVAETAVFYRDKLDFQIDFLYGDPPTHGGVSRKVWTGTGITLQLSQVPAERPITPAGALYIFVGSDLDALYAAYRARGVTILDELAGYPWGMREFAIADNNGHRLVFAVPG